MTAGEQPVGSRVTVTRLVIATIVIDGGGDKDGIVTHE